MNDYWDSEYPTHIIIPENYWNYDTEEYPTYIIIPEDYWTYESN